ncbi:hypothetical protein DP107_01295 [Haloglomus irregulare]|uniref:Uncharacterized protein n=1 Tax=Haloglomus irregulare TaxID=2234134 RepID=A0A554NEL9_9EURY|nr:hypothetical protein [Haloglomus irregulare]TSD15847.1 hypothetical protein DP107_01295 [Haloglomus irregulare]
MAPPSRPPGSVVSVVGFVATLAYVTTTVAGRAAGGTVPFAPLLAGLGPLTRFLAVYTFAPGPL